MDTKLSIPRDPTKEEFNDFSKLDNNQLFDKLIDDINGWGWFQKRMWVLSLIVCITAACNHLSPLYTAYSPQHRCISSGKLKNTTNQVQRPWTKIFTKISFEHFSSYKNVFLFRDPSISSNVIKWRNIGSKQD